MLWKLLLCDILRVSRRGLCIAARSCKIPLVSYLVFLNRMFQTFSKIQVWIFQKYLKFKISIFGFNMKNALKQVQTCLYLVQWFLGESPLNFEKMLNFSFPILILLPASKALGCSREIMPSSIEDVNTWISGVCMDFFWKQ